jgi:hypothetical protein
MTDEETNLSGLLVSRDPAHRAQGRALAEAMQPLSPEVETLRRAMALVEWLNGVKASGEYSLASIATGWDGQQVSDALWAIVTHLSPVAWPARILSHAWHGDHTGGLSLTIEIPRMQSARVVRFHLYYRGGDTIRVGPVQTPTAHDGYARKNVPLRWMEDSAAQAQHCARCAYGQQYLVTAQSSDVYGPYAMRSRNCTFREHYRDSAQRQGQLAWWDEWVCLPEDEEGPVPPCPGFHPQTSG